MPLIDPLPLQASAAASVQSAAQRSPPAPAPLFLPAGHTPLFHSPAMPPFRSAGRNHACREGRPAHVVNLGGFSMRRAAPPIRMPSAGCLRRHAFGRLCGRHAYGRLYAGGTPSAGCMRAERLRPAMQVTRLRPADPTRYGPGSPSCGRTSDGRTPLRGCPAPRCGRRP